jgi:hypothetical protein
MSILQLESSSGRAVRDANGFAEGLGEGFRHARLIVGLAAGLLNALLRLVDVRRFALAVGRLDNQINARPIVAHDYATVDVFRLNQLIEAIV